MKYLWWNLFPKIVYGFQTLTTFVNKLHHRYSTRFWKRLWLWLNPEEVFQRCSKNLFQINFIIDWPRALPALQETLLPDNIAMIVFVSLKTFFSTTRKCCKDFALGLTLKTSLGMNHTKWVRLINIKRRFKKFPLIYLPLSRKLSRTWLAKSRTMYPISHVLLVKYEIL